MPEDLIRYDILAQEALRGVVKKVLAEVARTGLPGAHHFYITFATRAPGVRISTPLLEKYPEEMTIVLQYAFRDLIVTDTAFEVGLSFGEVPERLLIPFAAIRAFLDPSVQFALHFEPQAAPEALDRGTCLQHVGRVPRASPYQQCSNPHLPRGLGQDRAIPCFDPRSGNEKRHSFTARAEHH